MITGMSLGYGLNADVRSDEGWDHDESVLTDPTEMLTRLVRILATPGARFPKTLPRYAGPPPVTPGEVLECACIEWFRTGKLSVPRPTDAFLKKAGKGVPRFLKPRISEEVHDEVRAALIVLAQVSGARKELAKYLEKSWKTRPYGGGTGFFNLAVLGESMLLCGPNAERLWTADLQVRMGWALRCVTAVNIGESPAPYLALGIHLSNAAKTDVGDLLRSTVRAMDDDLFVSDKKARVTVSKNLAWSVAGRGARGLDMTLQVKGKGGRISAGLPMVLEDGIYMMPKEVMDILSGERAVKEIHRARSRKEVLDLLRRGDSAITVRIELSPQLSIADEDLAAYRARLDVGLRWARGCFPELKASVRLVAE